MLNPSCFKPDCVFIVKDLLGFCSMWFVEGWSR